MFLRIWALCSYENQHWVNSSSHFVSEIFCCTIFPQTQREKTGFRHELVKPKLCHALFGYWHSRYLKYISLVSIHSLIYVRTPPYVLETAEVMHISLQLVMTNITRCEDTETTIISLLRWGDMREFIYIGS